MDKVKGWRKTYHANSNQMKERLDMLISNRIDFRTMKVIRDIEGHYRKMGQFF